MKSKVYILCCVIYFVFYALYGGENSYIIDGIAVIENNNIALARTSAIEDAQKKAINQYISGLIPSDLIVSNYKILDERIFSKVVNFVSSYKVIGENREGDIFRVKVEVFLTVDALKQTLAESGLVFIKGEYPRLLFMISEGTIDGNFYWWWDITKEVKKGICEDNIITQMEQRGFLFIEPEVVRQKIESEKIAQSMDLSVDILRKIGRDNGVDIVIFGKGTIRKGEDVDGSTLKLYYAKLSIIALYVESGKIIFESSEEAGGLNFAPEIAVKNAYKKVSDILAKELADVVERFWKEEVIKAQNIFIEIKNAAKLEDIEKFLIAVKKINNVKKAEIRSFSQDSSLIEAEIFNINLESLASQIMANIEDKQGYRLMNIKSDRIIFTKEQKQ